MYISLYNLKNQQMFKLALFINTIFPYNYFKKFLHEKKNLDLNGFPLL